MTPFSYLRPATNAEAIKALSEPDTMALAGGTTLVDLMRLEVMRPARVVDLGGLALDKITTNAGSITLGALATNTDVAEHPDVIAKLPALSDAIRAGASGQIRNMASVGGNLLQRTRCAYFRDTASPCNKRTPGSGCSALEGFARMHAIVGTSRDCIAAHPSDMCVALAALDAKVHIEGATGTRTVALGDFHTLPDDHPNIESVLKPGELVVAIEVPTTPIAAKSRYVKVRDRASYAFALASAAVALEIQGGTVKAARIALGGVGTKPWREHAVEDVIVGKPATREAFTAAANLAVANADTRPDNAFKVPLVKRVIVRTMQLVAGDLK
ncbi:MAG: xanthine dehydrogenase family protein subunit M [Kofleriaceae bacterium]